MGVQQLEWANCEAQERRTRMGQSLGCHACFNALKSQALYDQLTGLPNRYSLESSFARFTREVEMFGGISIDLTKFKRVNDTHGHERGDRFLRITADFLTQNTRHDSRGGTRHTDLVAARRGGDEFFVLAPLQKYNVDGLNPHDQLYLIAHRIANSYLKVDEIASYNKELPFKDQLSFRAGLSVYESGMDLEELVSDAESKGFYPTTRIIPGFVPFSDRINSIFSKSQAV